MTGYLVARIPRKNVFQLSPLKRRASRWRIQVYACCTVVTCVHVASPAPSLTPVAKDLCCIWYQEQDAADIVGIAAESDCEQMCIADTDLKCTQWLR